MSPSSSRPIPPRRVVKKRLVKKKSSWKRSFWLFFILFILIVAGAGCGFLGATMSSLPDVGNVKPAASSQIYDANGDLITTVHSEENRLPVTLQKSCKMPLLQQKIIDFIAIMVSTLSVSCVLYGSILLMTV